MPAASLRGPLAYRRQPSMRPDFLRGSKRSLRRGAVLSFAGVPLALWWSGFPEIHPSIWTIVPVLLTTAGTLDTARCMRKQWDFRHAGVLLLLYADMMTLTLELCLLAFPYLVR